MQYLFYLHAVYDTIIFYFSFEKNGTIKLTENHILQRCLTNWKWIIWTRMKNLNTNKQSEHEWKIWTRMKNLNTNKQSEHE